MLRYGLIGFALLQASATAPAAKPPLVAVGKGVQIYVCSADKGWVFQAPEATLYIDGKVVGSHGAGPRWTWKDGSAVTGKLVTSTPAPDAARDIPWLTLNATAAGTGGALSGTTTVRRTETQGGVAPSDGCDAAHQDVVSNVPYTAMYSFYR